MQAILVNIAAQALGAALVALITAAVNRLAERWMVPAPVNMAA
jgi:hypothetical protein